MLDSAGRKLGLAVANLITLLNPELLIICGEGTDLGNPYLAPIITAVREQTFADLGRQVEVKVQRWGNDAVGRGSGDARAARVVQPAGIRREEPCHLAPTRS